MPKVTVLLPIYNAERYLDECMSSVLGQTLEDLEIIAINDGSKDSSLEILGRYAERDPRVSILDKPNSGYGDSLNQGIDRAQGEYVTFVESDDYVPADAMESLYTFAKENGDLEWLKADADIFFGEGDTRSFVPAPISRHRDAYDSVSCPEADPGHFVSRAGPPGMYRVDYLNRYHIRHNPSPGASYQDTGFWAQCIFSGRKMRFLDKVTYYLRRDNPNSSELDRGKVYAISREYDFVRNRIDEMEGIDRERCVRACSYFRFQGYLWNCDRIATAAVREFLQSMSVEYRKLDAAGEIDRSLFEEDELATLEGVLADPDGLFIERYHAREELAALRSRVAALEEENARLRKDFEAVTGSASFRIGRAITAPGRGIRSRPSE